MVHIQPSTTTKMFRTLYTILHPYFSHLSEYPDFQNSTRHFPLTTRDFARSSAIQVPSWGCLLVPTILLVHGMGPTVIAGFWFLLFG